MVERPEIIDIGLVQNQPEFVRAKLADELIRLLSRSVGNKPAIAGFPLLLVINQLTLRRSHSTARWPILVCVRLSNALSASTA